MNHINTVTNHVNLLILDDKEMLKKTLAGDETSGQSH